MVTMTTILKIDCKLITNCNKTLNIEIDRRLPYRQKPHNFEENVGHNINLPFKVLTIDIVLKINVENSCNNVNIYC